MTVLILLIYKLPPNTTSVYQPLDAGIISAFKSHYKAKLLMHMVSTAPDFEELQALAGHLSAGCADVKYGCPPHIGDAIQLIVESWNSISVATIHACWSHADCLPVHIFPKVLTSQANGKRSEDSLWGQLCQPCVQRTQINCV